MKQMITMQAARIRGLAEMAGALMTAGGELGHAYLLGRRASVNRVPMARYEYVKYLKTLP